MIKKAFVVNTLFLISSLIIELYFANLFLIFLFVAAMYLFVYYSGECRGVENVWIFMLIAVGFVPINIAVEMHFYGYIVIFTSGPIGNLISLILAYAVLFGLEEILAGVVGRIIWREQKLDE